MAVKNNKTFIIPYFWAIRPSPDKINATIPQQKPFTNPDTILLNSGKVFCDHTSTTGWASIVVKPIAANNIVDINSIVLYVSAKPSINGKVPHIEKYITGFEPNIFSNFGLKKDPIEPAKTNKNKAIPM